MIWFQRSILLLQWRIQSLIYYFNWNCPAVRFDHGAAVLNNLARDKTTLGRGQWHGAGMASSFVLASPQIWSAKIFERDGPTISAQRIDGLCTMKVVKLFPKENSQLTFGPGSPGMPGFPRFPPSPCEIENWSIKAIPWNTTSPVSRDFNHILKDNSFEWRRCLHHAERNNTHKHLNKN